MRWEVTYKRNGSTKELQFYADGFEEATHKGMLVIELMDPSSVEAEIIKLERLHG